MRCGNEKAVIGDGSVVFRPATDPLCVSSGTGVFAAGKMELGRETKESL